MKAPTARHIAATAALAAAFLLLSCFSPPPPVPSTSPAPDWSVLEFDGPLKKVLIIGIDGLRPDAIPAAITPNLDELIENGCYTPDARTGEITVSGPGWSSMLTGVWMDKHGVRDNEFTGSRFDKYPHFFARLKEKFPQAYTAHIADWKPIDEKILGAVGADFRFYHDYSDDGDEKSVAAAVDLLLRHDPDVVFIYLADLDVAGHEHGFHPNSRGYRAELQQIDIQVGRIIAALERRAAFSTEEWLIIVSSDHGGTIDGSHGRDIPQHRKIPLIVSGPAAVRGRLHTTANIVDIPAIALTHLGVEIEQEWGLDGRPVGLDTRTHFNQNLLCNGNAEMSSGYSTAEFNAGIAGWTDTGTMTVITYGASEGFPNRGDIGPIERGDNFFCGGTDSESSIHQVIDVADIARFVDENVVRYKLSGYFGGCGDQRDLAWMTAVFLDELGGELGQTAIGPVTVHDRTTGARPEPSYLTGLIRKQDHGRLPAGTRRIRVTLEAEAGKGTNDGYADNLHLSLWMPQSYFR